MKFNQLHCNSLSVCLLAKRALLRCLMWSVPFTLKQLSSSTYENGRIISHKEIEGGEPACRERPIKIKKYHIDCKSVPVKGKPIPVFSNRYYKSTIFTDIVTSLSKTALLLLSATL